MIGPPPARPDLLLGLTALVGCSAATREPRPDILLVSLDTTRADHVDLDASDGTLTPTLARLAADGVAFEESFTPVPLTLPAHTSLLTGTEPISHGVRNNDRYRLGPEATTLAELLHAEGWATAAVIGAFPLEASTGLDQGFDTYDQQGLAPPDAHTEEYPERDASEVAAAALQLLAELPRPAFLFVHFYDPHQPWNAPAPWAGLTPDPYRAEIAYTDGELGKVVAAVRRRDPEAVVVVTADHGESLGEHGEGSHGIFLHDATTRVPLVVGAAGRVPARGVLAAPVARLTDVVPTILDLAGLPIPAGVQGRSLLPGLRGAPMPAVPVFAETVMPEESYGFAPMESLVEGNLRLVISPRRRLFDLRADPGEVHDIAATRAADVERLANALDAYVVEHRSAAAAAARAPEDPQRTAALQALGYVDLGLARHGGDIYEHTSLLALSWKRDAMGRPTAIAADEVVQALQDNPDLGGLWELGLNFLALRPDPRFVGLAREGRERFSGSPGLLALAAYAEASAGDFGRARAALAAFEGACRHQAEEGPRVSVSALTFAAEAALLAGLKEELAWATDRLRQEPLMTGDSLSNRARFLHALGRLAEAEADYRAAAAQLPDDPEILFNLAAALAGQGKLAEAEVAFARGLTLAPDQAVQWARRAQILQRLGRAVEADGACARHRALGGADPACEVAPADRGDGRE